MNTLPTPWKLLAATIFLAVAAWSPKLAYAAPSNQTQLPTDKTVRLMVKIDPNAYNEVSTAAFSADAVANVELSEVGWQVLVLNAADAEAIKAQLQATQGVVEVTPDYPLELTMEPNAPSYVNGEQWALD